MSVRYYTIALLSEEQQKSIDRCGRAENILLDIYDTKLRKYVARGIPDGKLELKVSDDVLAERRAKWVCPPPNVTKGYLARYAKLVSSANKGAIVE